MHKECKNKSVSTSPKKEKVGSLCIQTSLSGWGWQKLTLNESSGMAWWGLGKVGGGPIPMQISNQNQLISYNKDTDTYMCAHPQRCSAETLNSDISLFFYSYHPKSECLENKVMPSNFWLWQIIMHTQ